MRGGGKLSFALACACGSDEELPPPPTPTVGAATEDDGGGGLTQGPALDAGGEDGPDACVLAEAADESGDDGGGGTGFLFDVGAPEGGGVDFPVSCAEVADTRSNLGCLFWAVDLPNDYRGTPMSPPAAEQQFAVVVANASALQPAEVAVFVGDEQQAVATATVEPGATHQFSLDPLDIEPRESTADGLAYRIESSVPITGYQFNPLDNEVQVYSNDASLLLPVHALAQQYTAVTANAVLLGMSPDDPMPVNAGAFVSVVATEDATEVEIVATATLVGSPSSATLDRGQVLTVISDASGVAFGNLSGTRVIADKPVAVFSGNVATAIPADRGACCADHVEHQLAPHDAWGTAFAVAPPPSVVLGAAHGAGDRALYRLQAAVDGTELSWCPTKPAAAPDVLDAGQTAVFESDDPFTIESAPDRPLSLTQFLLSNEALGDGGSGDPAMIVVPSVGQFQRRYLFVVPGGYAHDWVSIVTRGSADVTLDGETIAADALLDVGVVRGQIHRYVHRPLSPGPHIVEASVPVGITVVGYDEAVSYGYAGGAGLRVIAVPPAAG